MTKQTYPYYLEDVDVNLLFLDAENPRLPDYLQGKSEDKIIEHMLLEESTLELMQAIGEKGFFKGEQLLVVKQIDGKFKVVEGNRRLTSVKLLNNPQLATAQQGLVNRIHEGADSSVIPINGLPCMVFENDADIHDYLGYRHVTGVQPWNLRQKAKYLNYLRNKNFSKLNLDDASNELRKIIGSTRPVVKRYLVGFEIYKIIKDKAFFKIKDLNEEGFYFSYVADSLSRSHIAEYLGVNMDADNPIENLDMSNLENWTTWLYEPLESTSKRIKKTRLKGKSGDLNKLNSILASDEARKQFIVESATLDEAHSYTDDFDKLFKDSILESLGYIEKSISIIGKVKNFYSSLDEDLREIIRISRNIKANKDILTSNEFQGDEFGK